MHMPIDPATIRAVLPKPGGREAVLVREVPDLAGSRIEVTLAQAVPKGGYHALRSIGISPAIRDGFVAAVGSLRTGGASSGPPSLLDPTPPAPPATTARNSGR